MIKTCPQHEGRELKEFTAGPNAKRPGSKYWKCTKLLSGEGVVPKEWCNYVEFEDSFITTKKFTQTPTGVVETQEVWPLNAPVEPQNAPQRTEPQDSDIRTILARIEAKIDSLKAFVVNEVL